MTRAKAKPSDSRIMFDADVAKNGKTNGGAR